MISPSQVLSNDMIPLPPFLKPLSDDDALTIQLLTERYMGKDGQPFLKFEDEHTVVLHVPKDNVRRISFGVSNGSI